MEIMIYRVNIVNITNIINIIDVSIRKDPMMLNKNFT